MACGSGIRMEGTPAAMPARQTVIAPARQITRSAQAVGGRHVVYVGRGVDLGTGARAVTGAGRLCVAGPVWWRRCNFTAARVVNKRSGITSLITLSAEAAAHYQQAQRATAVGQSYPAAPSSASSSSARTGLPVWCVATAAAESCRGKAVQHRARKARSRRLVVPATEFCS